MKILRTSDIRLVITDWDMPGMNGLDLCRGIRREDLSGYVYIIMLTGREGAKERLQGLCAGADDFLNKPLDPEELLVCLKQAERILTLETRDLALFALAKLAESRDSETGAHVERVQSYSRLIAKNLSAEVKDYHGVDEEFVRLLYQTSPLHDLGKVGIPDAILLKPGTLTDDEFAIMQTHTLIGAKTLDAAAGAVSQRAGFSRSLREIAATHHEKFDGSGYPKRTGRAADTAVWPDRGGGGRLRRADKPPGLQRCDDARAQAQDAASSCRESGSHFDPAGGEWKRSCAPEDQILAVRERLRDNQRISPRTTTSLPLPIPLRNLPVPLPCKLFWLWKTIGASATKVTELLAPTAVRTNVTGRATAKKD